MYFKNRHRNIIIFTLILALITTVIGIFPINAAESVTKEQFIMNQHNACLQNEKILNYFADTYNKSNTNAVSTEMNLEECYPDYYGGSFIDDNGELVVLIKDSLNTSKIRTTLKDVSDEDKLIFKSVQYSFSDLCDIMDTISDFKKENENNAYASDIVSCQINDMNNEIEVCIYDLNDEKVKYFKDNISSSGAIVFF